MSRKAFAAAAAALVFAVSSSCSSLRVRKGVFYPVSDQPPAEFTTESAKPVLEAQEQIASGQLLYYDRQSGDMVYASQVSGESRYTYEIVLRTDGRDTALPVVGRQFTSAAVSRDRKRIYVLEKNPVLSETILTEITADGNYKTEIAKAPFESVIPFTRKDDSSLIYVNASNRVCVREADGTEKVLYTLSAAVTVRKIAYSSTDDMLILSTTESRENGSSTSLLYRMNLDPVNIGAIDVAVNDFSMSDAARKTVYTKTTLNGETHLYEYNHSNAERRFIAGESVDRVFLSPYANYAVCTSIISSASPAPSIFLVNTHTGGSSQLLVNTSVTGSVFWEQDETGFLYCMNFAGGADPVYSSVRQRFRFDVKVSE